MFRLARRDDSGVDVARLARIWLIFGCTQSEPLAQVAPPVDAGYGGSTRRLRVQLELQSHGDVVTVEHSPRAVIGEPGTVVPPCTNNVGVGCGRWTEYHT